MPLVTMPAPDEIFESARRQILAQHAGIRPHMIKALESARATVRGDADGGDLPSIIILLLGELASHMAFEESVLLPIFLRNGVTGRGDEEILRRDHQRQREEFTALLDLARNKSDPAGLAIALQSLVADVLTDMIEEETHLDRVRITAGVPPGNGVGLAGPPK
jgi:hypothetical protein